MIKWFIKANFHFYTNLAVFAGCIDVVWNQFSLSDSLHAPHVSFLLTAGVGYVFYSIAAFYGYSVSKGAWLAKIEEEENPIPNR